MRRTRQWSNKWQKIGKSWFPKRGWGKGFGSRGEIVPMQVTSGRVFIGRGRSF